jgi:hypothetical protein
MKDNVIVTRTTPHFRLDIISDDGKTKSWKLCYTYRAIAKIEESTGLDLKKYDDFQKITSAQFPKIVLGGLEKFNPEVTLEEVLEVLNPEAQGAIREVVFDLMFPGLREAYEEKLKGGTKPPNAQAETTSV